VALADLNGTGGLDIIVSNNYGGSVANVTTLLNNGSGVFGNRTGYFNSNDYSYGLAVGDLNGDGAPDVVSTNFNGSTVSVRLNQNDGTGALGPATTCSTGSSSYPHAVALGDANGDGNIDIATANYYGWSASVLMGNGAGSFGAPMVLPGYGYPKDVALVDLNNDAMADVITSNEYVAASVWLTQTFSLELFNPNGDVAATGVTETTNFDLAISNFMAPAAGTYYARIGGSGRQNYTLVVTRQAVFDAENNSSLATAQPFGATHVALGHVDADSDFYSFAAAEGETVDLFTATPGDGLLEFVNTLNPGLRLYGPTGLEIVDPGIRTFLADGLNERILYTVPPGGEGTYVVKVEAEGGTSGDYVLDPSNLPADADIAEHAGIDRLAAPSRAHAGAHISVLALSNLDITQKDNAPRQSRSGDSELITAESLSPLLVLHVDDLAYDRRGRSLSDPSDEQTALDSVLSDGELTWDALLISDLFEGQLSPMPAWVTSRRSVSRTG
jgi:hypothetical protein